MQSDLFLVDTSAWIFALRKDFLPAIKDRIEYLLKENAIFTTGMVKLELLGGTNSKSEFQRLKLRLDALDSVEGDSALWENAYNLAFDLRRKGITVPYTDILIASCALKIGAILVHADAHFDLMQKHAGLRAESYVNEVAKIISK
jgi:hypothetical protein